MKKLAHIASRLFDTALMIEPKKLRVITNVIAARMGAPLEVPEPEASVLGDRRDRKPYEVTDAGIAVIDVCGSLVNRQTGMEAWSGMSSYEQLTNEIMDAATDPAIKGIVMRFDSPGGETSGVFDLAALVKEATKQKPTWAAVDDNCFSAAYLMASQCERIYVTQTGGVGSVGVIAQHCDQSGWDAELGLKFTTLYAGDRKNDFNPHEGLTDQAKTELQGEIDRLYGMFTGAVASGRGMTAKAVRSTEAGLFFGQKGIEVGFADKIGTFREALDEISAAANGQRTTSSGLAASAATEIPKKEVTMNDEKKPVADAKAEDLPDDEKDKDKELKKSKAEDEEKKEPEARREHTRIAASADFVMDMCSIAGMDLATARKLIGEKLTEAEVRQRLITDKAAEQAPPTRSITGPKSSGLASIESGAVEMARANPGLSKEQAYVRLLKANPQAYVDYLASRRIAAA